MTGRCLTNAVPGTEGRRPVAPSLHPSRIWQAVNQPLMRRWPKAGLGMRRFVSRAPHGLTKVPHCGAVLRPGDAAAAWLPCWERTATAPRVRAAARGPAGRGRAPGQRRVWASFQARASGTRCPPVTLPGVSRHLGEREGGRRAFLHCNARSGGGPGSLFTVAPRRTPPPDERAASDLRNLGRRPNAGLCLPPTPGLLPGAWDSGAGGHRAARLSPSHHSVPPLRAPGG